MHKAVSKRIDDALGLAEREGLLFAPKTQRDMRACRERVEEGLLCEPFPRLFARKGYWDGHKRQVQPYQILRTLSRRYPNWVFSSYSAACIWGLAVSLELLGDVHRAVPIGSHAGKSGHVVRHPVGIDDVRVVMGASVTSFEQTVVDCLLAAPFDEGLAIADSALRVGKMSRAALAAELERLGRGRHGIEGARRIVAYADNRAESGGESIARAAIIRAGFAIPDLQTILPNVLDVSRTFRVDGSWRLPDGRLVVFEFDGAEKYERFAGVSARAPLHGAVRKMMRERQREALLTAVCDAVIRFDYALVKRPGELARLLNSYGIPRVQCDQHMG